MIFINFKSYLSGLGNQALVIVKACQELSIKNRHLIPVVQTVDIFRISSRLTHPVWAQSADAREPVKNCGYITPDSLKSAGAHGYFINHSDYPKSKDEIKKLIITARQLGLNTVVFAKNGEEVSLIDLMSPDYICIEDPALIASDRSMINEHSDMLSSLIKTTKTPILVGAGIRSGKHYRQAIEAGAVGVVLSSQIMEATHPVEAIRQLIIDT